MKTLELVQNRSICTWPFAQQKQTTLKLALGRQTLSLSLHFTYHPTNIQQCLSSAQSFWQLQNRAMMQYTRLYCNLRLSSFAVRKYSQHGPPLPTPPSISSLTTPEDTLEARTWISRFKTHSIPKGLVEMSFSRSSGPGGQHVNKVNTKATLRCPVNSPWIPDWAEKHLKSNPHYVSSTDSILITSTVYRSQAQNIEDCLSKLHDLILTASSASVVNEPSEEQKKRVAALERADKARRRQEKSYRSEVKKGRAKGGWD